MPGIWKRMWAKVDAAGHPEALSEAKPEGAVDAEREPATFATLSVGLNEAQAAQMDELRSQIAALTAQLGSAPDPAKLIADAAESFAQAQVAGLSVLPAEKASLVDDYVMAAQDDAAHPVSSGASRLDRLKARVAARPRHSLTAEQIGVEQLPSDARVLPNPAVTTAAPDEPTPDGAAMTAARRERLLSKTESGRALLARERASGAK